MTPQTRRRRFMLGAAALALARGAAAQAPGRMARIGFLASSNPAGTPQLEAFLEGLRALGYVEGRDLVIEYRWAEGTFDRHPGLSAELVGLKVDLIVAWSSTALAAARQATSDIPIVMVAVGDPVGVGFIASLARPGGNVTGVSNVVRDTTAKQLELLAEVAPGIRRVAALHNPANPMSPLLVQQAEAAARALGLELQVVEARAPGEFESAFKTMTQRRAAALLILGDPMFLGQRQRLAELALKHRLPSTLVARGYPEAGGLMSYGVNPAVIFRRAASYVDRILKGAKPAEMPVEQPTTVELVVNLKTARALGLKVPQTVLLRTDKVIE